MNDKNKKIYWTIFVIIIYIILISLNLFSDKFDKGVIGHICYIVPLIWTLITYIYNHWDWLFGPVNKFWANMNGITSSFSLSYRFLLNVGEFENDFSNIYEDLKKTYEIMHLENKPNYKEIVFKNEGLKLNLDFKIDSYGYSTEQVVIVMDTSVSYKDSSKVTQYFFDILSIVDKDTGKIVDGGKLDNVSENKIHYGCTIELSKWNPFYRYQVKHISTEKLPNFSKLELKDNDIKVIIFKNKMKVNTSNKERLKEIVNEYIPISSIG